MCELLIRTQDKAALDTPDAQASVSQRGDVITIQSDGWKWSEAELRSPFWTILKMPGVDATSVSAFVQPEPGDPKLNPYLRRRMFKLDLDALGHKADPATRLDLKASFDLTTTLAQKVQRPSVADPDVIGAAEAGIVG